MAGMTNEQQVEAFNIEHPVGSPVTVHMDGGGILDTTVKHPAQVFGGHTPVVWLNGVRGCYALSRVFGYCHGVRAVTKGDDWCDDCRGYSHAANCPSRKQANA